MTVLILLRKRDQVFFCGVYMYVTKINIFFSTQQVFNHNFLFAEPRLDKSPFGNGFGGPSGPAGGGPLNPMAAQFMALNHPGAAHAAFLSQTAAMSAGAAAAGFPGGLPNSSPSSQQAAAAAAAAAAQLMKGPGLTSLEALQR